MLPETDFRDIVSLNTLKNKFIKDLKNDTDEGTEYLQECFLSNDVKEALRIFVRTYYETALLYHRGRNTPLMKYFCDGLKLFNGRNIIAAF